MVASATIQLQSGAKQFARVLKVAGSERANAVTLECKCILLLLRSLPEIHRRIELSLAILNAATIRKGLSERVSSRRVVRIALQHLLALLDDVRPLLVSDVIR